MKFNISKDLLLKELNIASEIALNKNIISLYNNTLIKSSNNILTLKSSDLKNTYESFIEVDSVKDGEILISTHKLNEILKVLSNGEITIEVGVNNFIHIYPKDEKERINYTIKGIDSTEFNIDSIKDKKLEYIFIESKNFNVAINNTSVSVSLDPSRHYNLSGVYFNLTEDKIEMVSTDTRRMAYVEFPKNPSIEKKNCILPIKILNLIKKNLMDNEKIGICLSDDKFYVSMGKSFYASEIIDSDYPNYRKIIPENNTYKVEISNSSLQTALKQIAVTSDFKTKKSIFKFNSNYLTLTSANETNDAQAELRVPIDSNIESEQIIALNHSYVFDTIKNYDKEALAIEFENNNRPVLITTLEKDENIKILHIIMTMQIN